MSPLTTSLTLFATFLLVYCSPTPLHSSKVGTLAPRSFPVVPHTLPLKTVQRGSHGPKHRRQSEILVDPGYESHFLTEVELGGQSVGLLVDTGSSDTWAVTAGFDCDPDFDCAFGDTITVNDEFDLIPDAEFLISYVDKSYASGPLANTSVGIADLTVAEQTIGLATKLGVVGDGVMTGLLGLAYPCLTSALEDGQPVIYSSIINTIFTQGLTEPLFSMAICRDASETGFGGYLTIGGIPDLSDPTINAVADFGSALLELNPEVSGCGDRFTHYTIIPDGLAWADASGDFGDQDATPSLYIVDSGTTLSRFPPAIAQAINALFDPPATLNSQGLYVVSCDATLPQLSLFVGGVELPVNPIDLVWFSGEICVSGVQSIQGDSLVGIIGDSLMRSLLVVFDWGEKMVHFASRPVYDS
ncbi:uncharacterized protein PV07_02119 [Cladophialophora immunda]|uniref:Peptidase A1 domain-containing protein n=1 Tax=Cladophialophora immunda TaxID=569365 RepID=A0A0D2BD37_9EURO|nr:uncharacterized protein PV07_02119 [Cladophialophora immunda]KIW35422.1 hypothetical protein PV07_02119 [Cladophialophora immunda]OQV02804.1 hypothetical protein CLAIMM_07938 [Cladophialophora immunda]